MVVLAHQSMPVIPCVVVAGLAQLWVWEACRASVRKLVDSHHAWWHMPVIPAFGRQQEENLKSRAIMGCIMNSNLA